VKRNLQLLQIAMEENQDDACSRLASLCRCKHGEEEEVLVDAAIDEIKNLEKRMNELEEQYKKTNPIEFSYFHKAEMRGLCDFSGRITDCNQGVLELFGRTKKEVLYMTLFQIVPTFCLSALYEDLGKLIGKKKQVVVLDTRFDRYLISIAAFSKHFAWFFIRK
jgi:PAS domain-containing protein